MIKHAQRLLLLLSALALTAVIVFGQAAGIILGTISDPSGAVIPNATLTITNKATGAVRTVTANAEGLYSVPALEAGQYEVRAEVQGFRTLVRDAQVEAGSNTTVNLAMTVGGAGEVVNVEAATAEVNYESHTVEGVVQRAEIQGLPLNGRNFLQLASLEPGVTISAGATSTRNGPVNVSILGGSAVQTRVTVDGFEIMDYFDGTGTSMNFSQEIIQEFQVSALNSDLSTGVTSIGTVNIVTRSGSNDFHGSGYYFYRDHNMAAYPGLKRLAIAPNPFFQRKNPGVWIAGPVLKNKLFFFFNYEDQDATAAGTVTPDLASIAPSANVYSNPSVQKYLTARFDYRLSDKHSAFLRYTHDGNTTFGPVTAGTFPSYWLSNDNWSDQWVAGLASAFTGNVVNDFRFAFKEWRNRSVFPTAAQCGPNCIGGGQPYNENPQLGMVGSSNWMAGDDGNAPTHQLRRNFQVQDTVTWQKGTHRMRFGTDIDWYVTAMTLGICTPGCLDVESVENTVSTLGALQSTYMPNLPTQVLNNAQLQQLPVYFTTSSDYAGIGAGSGQIPGGYDYGPMARNIRPQFFFGDTWKVKRNLTVNYGLAWHIDTGTAAHNIPQPVIETAIYGANNLGPTQLNKKDFSPGFGFAWSPGTSGKTVVRGGAGVYWDTWPLFYKANGSWSIDPIGDGRAKLYSTSFINTFPGIVQQGPGGTLVPLAVGSSIPVTSFSTLTLADWDSIYNAQFGAISAILSPPNPQRSGPIVPGTQGMDYTKTGAELMPPNFPDTHSYQTSLGVQRDMGHDVVITADWARRQSEHVSDGELDAVYFSNFVNGVRAPKLPVCTTAQLFVPSAQCATGSFSTYEAEGRSIYEGLLVKVVKRMSNRYQLVGSYALQNLNTSGTAINLNNYFESYGPALARQNLNISGVANLPWGFTLSLNSSMITRTPVSVLTTSIDLSGTGAATSGPLVAPGVNAASGTSYACFDVGCGKSQLAAAVAAFNAQYAGTIAPNGAKIPTYVLPPNYTLGLPTMAQDFRLTKDFRYKEKYHLLIMAEMFNAFNIANLSGYSYSLDKANANPANQTYAFGQPTTRAAQTFLSGGPRAVQLGARFNF